MVPGPASYVGLPGDAVEEEKTFSRTLEMCAPEKSPGPWAAVNLGVLTWSVTVLVLIFLDSNRLDEFRTQMYLFWSFTTTFVWVVEVGLSVWHVGKESSCREAVELVVAAYMTYVTAVVMWKHWCRPDKQVEGEVLDVGLTVAAYLYASEETCLLTWKQWRSVFRRADAEGFERPKASNQEPCT